MKGTEADKAADFANYFCSYAYLYHQKQMLMDHVRMQAYYSAIMQNKQLFQGKVILDVGTGSGVLAIWAAQAGAAKVYAVEYTDMAAHAKALVEANGLGDIVEVMQSSVEELELPCKVDIIVSEWMGYILLRESMLDSLIRARNKFLSPDGSMFPSHATLYFSLITNEDDRLNRSNEYYSAMNDWNKFVIEMKEYYNVNMSVFEQPYEKEQSDYYIFSSLWTELRVENLVGQPVVIKHLDINTCTIEDAECVPVTPFSISVPYPIRVSGFASWFTVDFAGSAHNPTTNRVTLSTGPEVGYTHWGQQVFYTKDCMDCQPDSKISGTVALVRQEKNKRLYDLQLVHALDDGEPTKAKYEIP
eukprot:CAMPEP_0182434426 /NCGR_PEP_ID=MMETSP1167-20130531/69738_1 /TAXON_ID=2988 /ORGANISM="Mallomonas Sp, Strain CCMP3275" /LENGTH=358 /DNA_ID=CAMNT_0024624291 /DNA_START=54 /DNA_END=1130 /DNA_ORIENTATION=+